MRESERSTFEPKHLDRGLSRSTPAVRMVTRMATRWVLRSMMTKFQSRTPGEPASRKRKTFCCISKVAAATPCVRLQLVLNLLSCKNNKTSCRKIEMGGFHRLVFLGKLTFSTSLHTECHGIKYKILLSKK